MAARGDDAPPAGSAPPPSVSTDELSRRATEVAELLRTRLLEVAREVAGPAFRQRRLVVELGLDKSLASRIARSLRSDSSYGLLHLVPSTTGLGMFLDRAAERGCAVATVARAREAVAEFQALVDPLPGGRASLDALMSESAVEVRERAERAASQSVYRAMSYLLGFQCEAITSAAILLPSADGRIVDSIEVSRREGIRRLRPSAPVALFSVDLSPDAPREAARMEALRPGADAQDPRSVLLPEFCDPSDPTLDVYRKGHHTVFALPKQDDSLHRGVTISAAFHLRNAYLRWRDGDLEEESRTYLLHYPCKVLIRDLYLHEDLYPGVEPRLRIEFPPPPGAGPPRPSDPHVHLNQLDLSAPVLSMGRGLHRSATAGAPQHVRLLEHVFQTVGLDPERFRGYRVRIAYPVPLTLAGWWIPLPPKP